MSGDIRFGLIITAKSDGAVAAVKATREELAKLAGAGQNVERGAQAAAGGLKTFTAGVLLGNLATSALNAAFDSLAKVLDAVKERAQLAARFDTMGVVLQTVGRNAGYTGAQMLEAARGVQAMGITMLESRESVARLVQAQIDLTSATKLARIAQDAAVIGGVNSSEAFKSLVYGIQSAQVEVLRTIGINVNFEASYQKLARELHTTVDALTEKEKVQARVNAVEEAGARIAGTYAAAMDTAGKQMSSLARLEEDLKVVQGELFQEALIVAVRGYTDHLKGANEASLRLQEQGDLRAWGRGLIKVFAVVADGARYLWLGVQDVVDGMLKMAKAVPALAQAAAALPTGDYRGAQAAWRDYQGFAAAANEASLARWAGPTWTARADATFAAFDERRRIATAQGEDPELRRMEARSALYAQQRNALADAAEEIDKTTQKLRTQEEQIEANVRAYLRQVAVLRANGGEIKDQQVADTIARMRAPLAAGANDPRAGARLALLKSQLEAEFALVKDAAERERQALDRQLQLQLISREQYEARLDAMNQARAAARVAELEREIAAEVAAVQRLQGEKGKNPEDERRRQAEVVKHQAELNKLLGEYGKARRDLAKTEQAADERAEAALKVRNDAMRQAVLALADYARALDEQDEEEKFRLSLIGKTADEQARLNAEHRIELDLKRQILLIDKEERTLLEQGNLTADKEKEFEALRSRARELAQIRKEQAADNLAQAKQLTDQAQAMQRAWKEVDDTAYEAFKSMFEKGADTFARLRDSLKNTLIRALYEMTVQKWIFQIAANVTGSGSAGGGVAGGVAAMGQAMSGGGAGGGAAGMLGQSGGLLSMVGSTVGNWIAGYAASSAATTAASTAMASALSSGASMTAASVAAAEAAATAATTTAASAASMIPVVGWIIAAIAIIASIASERGGPKQGAWGAQSYGDNGREEGARYADKPSGGGDDRLVNSTIDAINASYEAMARTLGGGRLGDYRISAGYEVDPEGTAKPYGIITVNPTDAANNALSYEQQRHIYDSGKFDPNSDNFALYARRALLAMLQASDLPAVVRDILAGAKPNELSAAEIDDLLQLATIFKTIGERFHDGMASVFGEALTPEMLRDAQRAGESIQQTWERLNATFSLTNDLARMLGHNLTTAFGDVGLASTDAREDLITRLGGNQTAAQLLNSYDQIFYSATERAGRALNQQLAQVTQGFADLGLSVPASEAEFRRLVEGLDLSTEAGRQMLAELMRIQGAFHAVTTAGADYINQHFRTQSERELGAVGDATQHVTQTFHDLGIAIPTSRAEFARLYDSIDNTTEAGRALRAALALVAEDFNILMIQADAWSALRDTYNLDLDGEVARRLNTSNYGQYQYAGDALQLAVDEFDGTTASLARLTEATQGYREAQVALLVDIERISQALGEMFDQTRQSIATAGMSDEERYNYLNSQADRLRQLMLTAVDPDEIQRYAQQYNATLTQAFGLLSPEQQRAQRETWLALIGNFETLVNDRLGTVREGVRTDDDNPNSPLTLVSDLLRTSATDQQAAATDQKQAAADMKQAASDMQGAVKALQTPADTFGRASGDIADAANAFGGLLLNLDQALDSSSPLVTGGLKAF